VSRRRPEGRTAESRVVEIDDLILANAKRGDREALGAVLQAHQATVYSVVSRMLVNNPEAVDDLAQEVFIKTIRFLPGFHGDGAASLASWIAKVATRTCLDFFRRPTPPQPVSFAVVDEWETDSVSPEQEASQKQLEKRMHRAMAELPADQRAALILRAYHDFDYPEIADALGVQVGTVKSRLNRARQALRERVVARSDSHD